MNLDAILLTSGVPAQDLREKLSFRNDLELKISLLGIFYKSLHIRVVPLTVQKNPENLHSSDTFSDFHPYHYNTFLIYLWFLVFTKCFT